MLGEGLRKAGFGSRLTKSSKRLFRRDARCFESKVACVARKKLMRWERLKRWYMGRETSGWVAKIERLNRGIAWIRAKN